MRTIFALILLAGCAAGRKQDADGFVDLFDGKSLDGWSAPDMSYFSVQDGAITGEATPNHLPPINHFLAWQAGKSVSSSTRTATTPPPKAFSRCPSSRSPCGSSTKTSSSSGYNPTNHTVSFVGTNAHKRHGVICGCHAALAPGPLRDLESTS